MRAFNAIVATTLRQLLGGRRLLILLPLVVIPALVVVFGTGNLTDAGAFDFFHEAPMIITYLIVVPVAALVLGAAALGDERRDSTLSFLVLRPLRRTTITAAKMLAAWLAAALVGGAAAGAAAAALGTRTGDWSTLGPMVLGVAISVAAYCAVFLVLGQVTQRAVLIGLIYVFVWETGITFAADSLANASLFRIGVTAYAGLVPGSPRLLSDPLGALTPGAGGAILKAAGIVVTGILAAAWLLRHRDLAAESG